MFAGCRRLGVTGSVLAGILFVGGARACDYSTPHTLEERYEHEKWLAEKKAVHILGQFIQIDAQDGTDYRRCGIVKPLIVYSGTGSIQYWSGDCDQSAGGGDQHKNLCKEGLKDIKLCFFLGDGADCSISPDVGEIWDIRATAKTDGSLEALLLGNTTIRFTAGQIRDLAKALPPAPDTKARQ